VTDAGAPTVAAAAPARVDFYVVEEGQADAAMRVACRLAEKAWRQGHEVWLRAPSDDAVRFLDDLLWTFRQESFVPHQTVDDPQAPAPAPVLIAGPEVVPGSVDVLINLAEDLPAFHRCCARIAEIVGPGPSARAAGRERYRGYREAGAELQSHKL